MKTSFEIYCVTCFWRKSSNRSHPWTNPEIVYNPEAVNPNWRRTINAAMSGGVLAVAHSCSRPPIDRRWHLPVLAMNCLSADGRTNRDLVKTTSSFDDTLHLRSDEAAVRYSGHSLPYEYHPPLPPARCRLPLASCSRPGQANHTRLCWVPLERTGTETRSEQDEETHKQEHNHSAAVIMLIMLFFRSLNSPHSSPLPSCSSSRLCPSRPLYIINKEKRIFWTGPGHMDSGRQSRKTESACNA